MVLVLQLHYSLMCLVMTFYFLSLSLYRHFLSLSVLRFFSVPRVHASGFFFGLNFISLLYFYSSSVLRFPPCLLLTFLPSVSFLFWITARSFVSLPARLGVASGSFAKRNEFTMILLYTPLSQRVSLFLK